MKHKINYNKLIKKSDNKIILPEPLPVQYYINYTNSVINRYCYGRYLYYKNNDIFIEFNPSFYAEKFYVSNIKLLSNYYGINLILNKHIIVPDGKIYSIDYEAQDQREICINKLFENEKIKNIYINDPENCYKLKYKNFYNPKTEYIIPKPEHEFPTTGQLDLDSIYYL